MDELVSDGDQHKGDVEMERRRAEMHRRIMQARRSERSTASAAATQPDATPSSA